MNQILIIIGLLLTIINTSRCQETQKKGSLEPLEVEWIVNEENDTILIGQINRKNLELNYTYNAWLKSSQERSRIPENWVDEHIEYTEDLSVKIYLGTWCSDTQRELGAMIKILDALKIPDQQIQMFALSESKDSPQGFELVDDIRQVPTLIFLKNGKELNRIVEFPIESLHQDISKILRSEPYQHAYYGF